MYITRQIEYNTPIVNADSILHNLFNDLEVEVEPTKARLFYSDMSYTRYRTTATNILRIPRNYTNFSITNFSRRVITITARIRMWLQRHEREFRQFEIPKKSGGKRLITAPAPELNEFMREILADLQYLHIYPHDSAYAYIKQRDCKKAIERHQALKSNWFLKLDIKKFFNNCNPDLLRRNLRKLFPFALLDLSIYNNFIDALISLCYYNNELPQGTPLSPTLTNWIMLPIDYELTKVLNRLPNNLFVYTRYADDMLISSKTQFNIDEIIQIVDDILRIHGDPSLKINRDKTRYGSKAGRNWNLGIMYNKDNNLTVGHKRKKKIKSLLFEFYEGNRDYDYTLYLNGQLAYLKNIEPDYYEGLMKHLKEKYNFNFELEIKAILKSAIQPRMI